MNASLIQGDSIQLRGTCICWTLPELYVKGSQTSEGASHHQGRVAYHNKDAHAVHVLKPRQSGHFPSCIGQLISVSLAVTVLHLSACMQSDMGA